MSRESFYFTIVKVYDVFMTLGEGEELKFPRSCILVVLVDMNYELFFSKFRYNWQFHLYNMTLIYL